MCTIFTPDPDKPPSCADIENTNKKIRPIQTSYRRRYSTVKLQLFLDEITCTVADIVLHYTIVCNTTKQMCSKFHKKVCSSTSKLKIVCQFTVVYRTLHKSNIPANNGRRPGKYTKLVPIALMIVAVQSASCRGILLQQNQIKQIRVEVY